MTDGSRYPQQLVDQVDELLGKGYLGRDRVEAVASAVPELEAAVIPLLQRFASMKDWRRFEKYAIVAANIHPDALGEILCDVLDSREGGFNAEDLVDLLGEIHYARGVSSIANFIARELPTDAPYFGLSEKCIHSLGEIDTSEAQQALRELTQYQWPNPVRWHAAVELGIEEELGFDEDEMLQYP
jgi:hypothetical protein